METTIKQKKERKGFKSAFINTKRKITNFFDKVLSTNKGAVLLLLCILSIVMIGYYFVIYFVRDNFYQNWSDDSLQYYPFMIDFVDSIKSGTFSMFNYKNYLGASFYSDTYYVPLDGFTLIIFLLSFIFRTEIAMSIVEIIKLITGSMAIAAFLGIRGYKPKTIFLIGLLYFSSSGITCFSCFPSFTSLAFYLPFSLIIGHYFLKGKWYFVSPFAAIVVLYNFYLAYTVFAFMSFSMLVLLSLDRDKFFRSVLKLVLYVALILLGLGMSLFIFLPSMEFILQSTSRNVAASGSIKGLIKLFEGYIEIILTALTSTFKMFFKLFTTPTGLLKNRTLIYDMYLPVRQLYHDLCIKRTVDDLLVLPSFFNVEEFFRVMSTTYTPLTPSSFYGYQGSYFIEHVSLYITGAGLVLTTYIWFMKGYKSNVFKITMILSMIMMLLPFFSYILSANLEVLYTRWFNVITIPMLIIAGYVIDSEGLFDLKPKKLIGVFVVLIYFGVFGAYHHLYKIRSYGYSNEWDNGLLTFENKLFYFTLIAFFIMTVTFIGMYIVETKFKNKIPRRITYAVTGALGLGLIVLVGLSILKSYNALPKEVWSTSIKESVLFDTNDQMAFQYLTFVTLVMILITIYSICSKKKLLFKIIVCLEFILSAGMSFGSNIILKGRVTTYKNSHNVGEFLRDNLDERDVYRVYIDSSISNLLASNIARFMPTGTNQNIFHSFIYTGTDEVANIIYDKSNEGQANKKALNTYSYYLNILLGYKYVVARPSSSFSNYDKNQFELVNENDEYMLLKFKDYTPFLVYDNYSSRESFTRIKNNLNDIAKIKLMLNTAIIEKDNLELIQKYYETENNITSYKDVSSTESFYQRVSFDSSNSSSVYLEETTDGVNKTGYYYRYAFNGVDEITTRSYAINLFGYDNNKNELVENKEIFLKLNNGTLKYLDSSNISSKNGSTFHIPVYGTSDVKEKKPEAIYIFYSEDKETVSTPTLRYTAEAILPSSKYIESYENGENLPNGEGLEALLKFPINNKYDNGVIRVNLNKYNTSTSLAYNTMYFEYEDGTLIQSASETTLNKPLKNIYIVKTAEVHKLNYPPQLKITTYTLEGSYSDSLLDKDINVKGSKINLSYKNSTVVDGYNVIVIPIAYSEEWIVEKGNVLDTLPVNGGFMGLVVPKNIESNDITIKFEPTGLKLGLNISLLSLLFFIEITAYYFVNKERKENRLCRL